MMDIIDNIVARRLLGVRERNNSLREQRMAIYANDHIGVLISIYGFYELQYLEEMFRFLSPLNAVFRDGVALDIGANIGNHSVFFRNRFKQVHAFEPNPYSYQLLSFNSRWASNVVTHNIGLGDEETVLPIYEDIANIGSSSLIPKDQYDKPLAEVAVRRLDDLDLEIQGVSLIKIDVEGFESKVLAGGIKTIEENEPLVILEQHKKAFYNGTTKSIAMLEALGYKMCWHERGIRSNSQIAQRMFRIWEFFAGRRHKIIYGIRVPVETHPMLVAVPPRFQEKLGVAD